MEAGGFTAFRPLDQMDQRVFEAAFEGFIGVGYTPYAVSTQVVNGTNYRFLCVQTLVVKDPLTSIVIVTVHVSSDGKVTRKEDLDVAVQA